MAEEDWTSRTDMSDKHYLRKFLQDFATTLILYYLRLTIRRL